MNPSPKNKTDFIRQYGRKPDTSFETVLWYSIASGTLLFVILLFWQKAMEYKDYDPSRASIPEERIRRIFIDIYGLQDSDTGQGGFRTRGQIRPPERISTEDQRDNIERDLIRQGLIQQNETELDTAFIMSTQIDLPFELATESDLDNILEGFERAYRRDKARQLQISRASREVLMIGLDRGVNEVEFDKKAFSGIDFGEERQLESDRLEQGFRTKEEIREMELVVNSKEHLFKSCAYKLKQKEPETTWFFRIEFQIDSLGILQREKIKILDTNITDKATLDCILRRAKYLNGFKKATQPNAANYYFRKKYVF